MIAGIAPHPALLVTGTTPRRAPLLCRIITDVTHLQLKPGTSWSETYARCVAEAPEAFESDRLLNLFDGRWQRVGRPGDHVTPVDGTPIQGPPQVDRATAAGAVEAAVRQHAEWSKIDLAERKARVTAALDALTAHRDLLALLLVWEIGKPWRLACADVDRGPRRRALVRRGDRPAARRRPRPAAPGPVSNIASWNYPMSVLVHAELVQLLAGNAVIAKTPTQGGAVCLTARARAHAPRRAAGHPAVRRRRGAVRGAGPAPGDRRASPSSAAGPTAARSPPPLLDTDKRHFIEQEGLNAWGVWDFTQWDLLAAAPRKGFEYGKQRCTAYPRFVVQRELVDRFLDGVPAGGRGPSGSATRSPSRRPDDDRCPSWTSGR